jgi:hypothetical protein
MAQLHGYQRPPRGGKGRCQRACERTPLRGRRRCAAGERQIPLSLPKLIEFSYKIARYVTCFGISFGLGPTLYPPMLK